MKQQAKKVAALIVAAGEGRRMKTPRAKPFIPLKGVPVLVYAIQPFEACDAIQSLYPVLRKQDIPLWRQEILQKFDFKKTRPPVTGGTRRQDSVRLGLESIREEIDIILIHDAARPFVDIPILEQLLKAMEKSKAAVLAVPAKETIKIVSSTGHTLETPARESLWHIQTPQAFEYPVILEAHRRALADAFTAPDDSTLVERLGIPVTVIQGSYKNIKITTGEDLIIARAMLEHQDQMSTEC